MRGSVDRAFESRYQGRQNSFLIDAYLEANRKQLGRLQEELRQKNVPTQAVARVLRLPQNLLESCDS